MDKMSTMPDRIRMRFCGQAAYALWRKTAGDMQAEWYALGARTGSGRDGLGARKKNKY